MAILPLDQLQPGMRLAKEVREAGGRLLLGAGETIDERHLRLFKAWGVPEAHIAGPEPPSSAPPVNNTHLTHARRHADQLFSRANREHPAMARLYDLALQRLAAQPQGDDHG